MGFGTKSDIRVKLLVLLLALAFPNITWAIQTPGAMQYGSDIVSASAGHDGEGSVQAAVDGTGMDGTGLLHDGWYDNKWSGQMDGVLGASISPRPGCADGLNWFEVVFDKNRILGSLWVWNFNDTWGNNGAFYSQRGAKEVVIEYSTTGGTNASEWTRLGGAAATYEFAKAPGAEDYAHNTEIDLNDIEAKYIVITPLSIWGSPPEDYAYVGWAELAFFEGEANRAIGPNPASGTLSPNLNLILNWTAGDSAGDANGHDIYFGTEETAVTNATTGNPMDVYQGRQSETSFDPLGLEADTTYYWRIDEVNESDPNIWTGKVWNFTTVDVIAILQLDSNSIVGCSAGSDDYGSVPSKTKDESGLTGDLHDTDYANMWIGTLTPPTDSYNAGTVSGQNWITYEFDKTYDLEKMWVWNYNDDDISTAWQCGLKNVTIQYSMTGGASPAQWLTLGGDGYTHQFAPAAGSQDYAHNTEIDFGGAKAKYVVITPNYGIGDGWWGPLTWIMVGLSEVRLHYFAYLRPATNPAPADDTTNVANNSQLTWSASDYATSHDVYFGTSLNDVTNAIRLPGDATGDGPGNIFDAKLIATWWLTDANGSQPYADLDDNGSVNARDFAIVANDFGKAGDQLFKGNTLQLNYNPGTLDYNNTYYWRIDGHSDSGNFAKGDTWSFSTHIAPIVEGIMPSASSSNYGSIDVISNAQGMTGDLHSAWWPDNWCSGEDGSGYTNPNPGTIGGPEWVRFDFDGVYKLGDLWVWQFNDNYTSQYWPRGMRNVTIEYSSTGGTDSSDWTRLGDFEFAVKNPSAPDMPHSEEIAFNENEARYVVITANDIDGNWSSIENRYGLAEVRFYGHSPYASGQAPAEGAQGLLPGTILTWKPGVNPLGGGAYISVSTHDLYIGTDATELTSATRASHTNVTISQNQAATTYAPTLAPGTTYHWRVDEVNDANVPEYKGQTWSFSTTPPEAWNLKPDDSGVTARILYWEPGFYAADVNGHNVYIGTSYNDVNSATTASPEYAGKVTKNYYDIASYDNFNGLTLGDTYYWRIDEVNDTVGPPFKGTTQSFTHARRVIFNSDGYGILVGVAFGESVGDIKQWLSNLYDPLDGSRVDTVSWCDGSGGNTALYGSEVLEPWGFRVGTPEPTITAWIAEGNDPAKVVVQEGHKRGYEVWYSFRINDIHDSPDGPNIEEEFPTFKADNPSWMIGSLWPYGYSSSLRFDVNEVRDIKFDTIVEMFTKYDFDGIEIDWMRSPTCFYPGTEPDNNDILTTFMARVRTRLNEIGIQRGRPCLVAARVDETVETCDLDGFDVNSWVEQDLLDILILGSGVIDHDVEDFRAMATAAGSDLKIYPCLYGYPSNYRPISTEIANAMATTFYNQGSDGIYTFNYYLQGASQYQLDIHYDVGDAAGLIGTNKLYPADRGVPAKEYPHNWWNLALPSAMTTPQTINVPLRVGEDIDGTYTPASIQLRVGFDNDLDAGDTFIIHLNGNPQTQTRGTQEITMTPPASQVQAGENTVSIQITAGAATTNAVELHVNY